MNESQIFEQAIGESNPKKRAELIDALCAGDVALKARVEQLLAAHDQPNSYFENPLAGQVGDPEQTRAFDAIVQPGKRIGPYKLLQQIGEGGMGLVFMAEQTEPVKRRVALKIIKPGMDSRQVIARFEAERQALAMMDHPNIAKVLDAGTTEHGYPYFVMELVNGLPIVEYCDQEKLSTDERLHLFVSVCFAVQHAHQKGIIHRDLKPSNILVAEYDGHPVAKVIDFGVAKATGAQLTDKTLFTQFGQLIGTVEYMSPEQARRNQLDVDTRSDIYSLGMVLYKLLTGETPFGEEEFRNAAFDQMLQMIREVEPPRPSAKIDSCPTLDQVAERRNIEPRRLSSVVRGDLDWIVLKSLEKDRNRRYQSTGELAEDIQRHLKQLPIEARPHSLMDRLVKYSKRNQGAVTQLFVYMVVAGVIGFFLGQWLVEAWTAKRERTEQLSEALDEMELALVKAEAAPMGESLPWQVVEMKLDRVMEIRNEGPIESEIRLRCKQSVDRIALRIQQQMIAEKIEDVVIGGATYPDLESWQKMEVDMRDFFRKQGFDLDKEEPAAIGRNIRNHPWATMWADLLELWIGARARIAGLGGPPINEGNMQPWADAIYEADSDPIRTGIRRFIYTPPRKKESLYELIEGVNLSELQPRTLAWLGHAFGMVGENEKACEVFDIALLEHPRDLMLNFDYALMLHTQKDYERAIRYYHRCLAIRDDVPGVWKSMANTFSELGEDDRAQQALDQAKSIANQ